MFLKNLSAFIAVLYSLTTATLGRADQSLATPENDAAPASDEPETEASCTPACNENKRCEGGVCVGRCGDGCFTGEVCSRNGHCINRTPVKPMPSEHPMPPSHVRPPPPPSYNHQRISRPLMSTANPELNKRLYARFVRKKNAGVSLMAVGLIFIFSAIGVAAWAGADGEEEMIWAAVGIEVTGDLFFFPGLAMMVKGKHGMRKAKAGFYTQRDLSWRRIRPLLVMSRPRYGQSGRPAGFGISFSI